MKQSRRTKRMQLHHARRSDKNSSLNMVSLMDIFTILVFFLLVSAANTEVLPSPKNIELPESTAEKMPKENVIIMVNDAEILVQGKKVVSLNTGKQSNQSIIPALLAELKNQAKSGANQPGNTTSQKRGVTIMGDKQIPYKLLKKIMLTCASADYTNISLAVMQRPVSEDQSS